MSEVSQKDKAGSASTVKGSASLLAPLKERAFRNIWTGSLFSNFGQLIQGVGAAWLMTSLSKSPQMVALVQAAMTLPVMLLALPAGAIADMFDRRKVAMIGLASACLLATALTGLTWLDMITPWLLLAFCFLVGSGVAVFLPAWQSSISEQVTSQHLPSAIALSSISFNLARSLGPAVGGLLVAIFGATIAFGINVVAYIPMFLAFLVWKRTAPDTPPMRQRLDRAIFEGVRHAARSSTIRTVLLRTLTYCLAGAAFSALAPLIARDLLHGNATTYGVLLAAYGVGSILGSMAMPYVRARFTLESATRLMALLTGMAYALTGISHSILATCLALLLAGATWMLLLSQFNVAVQISAPRALTARVLACYTTMYMGGFAFGAWIWGGVATAFGTGNAMIVAGAVIVLNNLLSVVLPLPSELEPAH